MTKKLRKSLYKILWATAFFAAALLPLPQIVKLSFFALSYVIVGLPIVIKALQNIKNGEVFDENFLMTVATFGAVALGEYPEAVAVMLFFLNGGIFFWYVVFPNRRIFSELCRQPFAQIHCRAYGYPSGFCPCAEKRRVGRG